MKDNSTYVYAITQHYVRDNQVVLGKFYDVVSGWIRSRSLAHLASCTSLLPKSIVDREQLRCLMQIEAFFKKNSVYSSPECDEVALSSFNKAERVCRITNKRLDHYLVQRERLAPDLDKQISRMERWISSTLGDFSDFLSGLPGEIRITSGATSTRSRRNAQPFLKVRKRVVATQGATKYLNAISQFLGYGDLKFNLAVANRVETVPKNWKTHRTIACEPEGNVPLQLAFDSYTKRCLRKRGIDLRYQSRNQRLAKEASITGDLATIDLSMASDTLSFNTVAGLLPGDWFRYLADVRSSYYRYGRGSVEVHKYAKFSSMGNGATFALETLVFAAACVAVGSKRYSVYGDDIIIETELVPSLLKLMRFLGFAINQEKSHTEGLFRESCGVNAFNGVDITPFYIRDINKLKANWCHIVNGLASIALPDGHLEAYVRELILEHKLPAVPFNEDTMSGVFIDIHSAYHKKLLRSKPGFGGLVQVKKFVSKSGKVTIADSRTLFLWHLDANRLSDRDDHLVRSLVPTPSHKYVRKWVYWHPPVAGTPFHLYRWTESIIHLF